MVYYQTEICYNKISLIFFYPHDFYYAIIK